MGYTVSEVSKELNIDQDIISDEIQKIGFKDCIYLSEGITYIKEEGVQKLLEKIDSREIYFKSNVEYERELNLLKMELLQTKRELEQKNMEIKILEKKITELSAFEKRVVELEEKVVLNIRSNLVKRSERNKKKKWF